MSLRRSHPNLFWATLGASIAHIGIGLQFMLHSGGLSALQRDSFGIALHIMPLFAWGVISLILGVVTVLAVFFWSYPWVRVCQAWGAFMAICWTLNFTESLVTGAPVLAAPFLWFFFGVGHLTMLREPPSNPVTENRRIKRK